MLRNVLIIHGGWEGHHPRECAERWAGWLRERDCSVVLSDTLEVLGDLEALLAQDLVVPCWTMGHLTEHQEQTICRAVEDGVGLAGWHGGMGDAFRSNTQWQFMVGGQFVAHPGDIQEYTVDIIKADPLTAGINRFKMLSEQYYMHVDPSNDVLAATTFTGEVYPWISGAVIPVVWRRRYGQGRVFYCSLGHSPTDFDVPECRELLLRGMLWACRGNRI